MDSKSFSEMSSRWNMVHVDPDGNTFHLVREDYVKNTPACSGCAFMLNSTGGTKICREAPTCTPKDCDGVKLPG